MSTRYRHGQGYIRRLSPKDKTTSLMMAYEVAIVELMNSHKRPWVFVRHGYPHEVLAVSGDKQSLKERMGYPHRSWREVCNFFKEA